MKIRAIQNYFDLQLKKHIKIGDEYEVSEKRANQIIDSNFAIIVVDLEKVEEEQEEIKKPKKTSKRS